MIITKLRARFVSNGKSAEEKGYHNNTFYDIKIKQEGEKLIIKKLEDTTGISKHEYQSFDSFCSDWTIHFKYL